MSQLPPLVIVGATSLVAPYLMRRMQTSGMNAEVISRKSIDVPAAFTLTVMDLTSARNWIAPENAVVVSFLPLWLLAQFLPRFIGIQSIIAVGSTSVFSKADSVSESERKTASDLEKAENVLHGWCKRSLVHYTLLRPTMIYDGRNDKNITRMAQFIRRYRFLPMAAPASGKRQPIHADDVAAAVMGAINNPAAYDKAFNIAGGEVLSYREIVERVFIAVGLKQRLFMLPTEWLMKMFHAAESMGLLHEKSFGSAIFQRMNEDLIFDVAEGLSLLKYEPRAFRPEVGLIS